MLRGALVHVPLAGVLGVVAAVVGSRWIAASLLEGGDAFLGAVVGLTAAVAAPAVLLDVAVGPGRGGVAGSVLRGVLLAAVGCLAGVVLAFAAARWGVATVLPVPLRYAALALPFAGVAALQWRRGTGGSASRAAGSAAPRRRA